MLWSLAVLGFFLASAQGRAVNISNTWVLPEEGFPVFYRYFRDRISWYEADAVCQFHHANLVTVDTTAQYDAVRAYLKELDISSAVWVGLIRSNPDGDFTWTDYRGLSGDGYWSSAPDPRSAPLCAAADPAADYRWEARACGGPTVASFICELPVPQWALGNEGCMVRALPALTVLYLPESAAVQLTADCGLAGVKKIQCTGNVKRDDLLKGLSCAQEEESSTQISGVTSGTPLTSSDNPFTDQDIINDGTTEDNITTEHEDDINQSSTSKPIAPYNPRTIILDKTTKDISNKDNNILSDKGISLEDSISNNLQSNDIPKLASYDNYLSSDLSDKLEDEKHMKHKLLHDEIARHGNFETIFTQPTDHFIPPLVMAKAKISDDMTVLSLEEKHAQQLAGQRFTKHLNIHNDNLSLENRVTISQSTKDDSDKNNLADVPLIVTTPQSIFSDGTKKDVLKTVMPKKYVDKQYGHKNKISKSIEYKSMKNDKTTEMYSLTSTGTISTTIEDKTIQKIDYEPTIDLTVIIKEPNTQRRKNTTTENNDFPKIEVIENDTSVIEPEIKLTNPENNSSEITQEISLKLPTKSINNLTVKHEVIKITIFKAENSSDVPTTFEVATKMPIFDDDNIESTHNPIIQDKNINITYGSDITNITDDIKTIFSTSVVTKSSNENPKPDSRIDSIMNTTKPKDITKDIQTNATYTEHVINSTETTFTDAAIENGTETNGKTIDKFTVIPNLTVIRQEEENSTLESHEDESSLNGNTTDTSHSIDDFQSPLLSGANEPVHRPNRSRRPQQPTRNKFNPFRILG